MFSFVFCTSPPLFHPRYLGQFSSPRPSLETSEKQGEGAMGAERELCRVKGKGKETDMRSTVPQETEGELLQPAVATEVFLM